MNFFRLFSGFFPPFPAPYLAPGDRYDLVGAVLVAVFRDVIPGVLRDDALDHYHARAGVRDGFLDCAVRVEPLVDMAGGVHLPEVDFLVRVAELVLELLELRAKLVVHVRRVHQLVAGDVAVGAYGFLV